MNTSENQDNSKQSTNESVVNKRGSKNRNPGLRALLSVKHFNASLEKDYDDMMIVESQLKQLNHDAELIIEANIPMLEADKWKLHMALINKIITGINYALTSAKDKSEQYEKDTYPEFWKQLNTQVTELKNSYTMAINNGLLLLPEKFHTQWEDEFIILQTPLLESYVAGVESCRILLQMIERYTPDELDAITKIIADHVPLDYTYEEALEYQSDYYKALINFTKEFKKEKNLWDKFLDILAGGTHQSPSERVMFERWIEGEKGDL